MERKPEDVKEPTPEEKELATKAFASLLNGESLTEVITTSRGDFTIKYPLGRDFIEIDRKKAIMRGGIMADQFDQAADSNMEAYASLDVVVVESPDWWKKLKSSIDCPDTPLIKELYRGYLQYTNKVRSILQVASSGSDDTGAAVQHEGKTVGGGLFSRLAFGPGKPK